MGDGLGAPGDIDDDDLAVFLEMSAELYGVFDVERGLVWSNAAAAKTLGYSDDELSVLPIADLIHPDDLEKATELFRSSTAHTEPAGIETRYRCKDGSWRWFEWTARRAPGSNLVYGAARDVTARHVTRSELAAQETRLQAILDHSTAAIFVKDPAGRYVLVNETFVRLLGVRREDVIGKTSHEVWPGVSVVDDDARVLEHGETFTRDDHVRLDDGVHTVLTVRFPLLDSDGKISGMAAIATDITEATQVEAVLAERQRLLDTVIRACPDIVTVLDGKGRVQQISEASARILGYDLDNPVHGSIEGLVHADDLSAVRDAYERLMSRHDTQLDIRYRARHADGRWVVLDTRGQAINAESGAPAGAVVVSRDVTSELEIEDEMRAAVKVAEQASMAKSEFLSRMSHELRTPLNSVLGFTQLLEMDELPDHQGEAVGHVMRAGRHLLNLIDEVLDIARIESGNLELLTEAVSLEDVVGEAVDLSRPLAERRGVEIALDAGHGQGPLHVLADRQRLLQVLLNLLSNAVKYNRAGGRVDVSLEVADRDWVRITVADTGMGISPEDIGRVFEPFDRLGAEHSGVEGTGVGLTVSKHLVERMGGSVGVQSRPGEGSRFTVDLFLTSEPEPLRVDVEAPGTERHLHGSVRVLHVEDNLANLELVEQVLTRSGVVDLFAAMSGSLGLELAREHTPDLILLDLHLPDMSGTELLEKLRQDPVTADIPVVVVTADAIPGQIARLRNKGVAGYLTKPIDVHDLVRVVETASEERSAR